MRATQHIPAKKILSSRKLKREEVLLAQHCIQYLTKLAMKLGYENKELDAVLVTQETLVEKIAYLSQAMSGVNCNVQLSKPLQ